MNASELKAKTVDELSSELDSLLREGFNLRMQKATGQLTLSHQVRLNRRSIARIKTIISQKAGVADRPPVPSRCQPSPRLTASAANAHARAQPRL